MKAHQTSNRMRSAIAPRMSAGVMIANMAWNMTNAYSGMPRGDVAKFAVTESSVTPASPAFERSPIPALPVPKARLYPSSTHRTPTMPAESMHCMSTLRTFFARTRRP